MFVVFLFYSQSVYSTQLCVHTEQWIHNFGLTPVLAQRLAVWSVPKKEKEKKTSPWRANFREPRSTALYPNPRYNEARYNEGRLYYINIYIYICMYCCIYWVYELKDIVAKYRSLNGGIFMCLLDANQRRQKSVLI